MDDKTSENFKTPKMNSVRTLGLRRRRSDATPSSTPLKKIVIASDEKVYYRQISPATPVSRSTTPVEGRAATTGNCRPYGLALSKRMRDRLTKKRLEFHVPREEEPDDGSAEIKSAELKVEANKIQNTNIEEANDTTKPVKAASANIQEGSREQLLTAIKIAQTRQHTRLQHNKKVAELKSAIEKWKTAFGQAMQELKELIGLPLVDNSRILEQLQIPQSMLTYLED